MEFQDELSGVFLCCSAECDALKSVLANRLEVGFLAGGPRNGSLSSVHGHRLGLGTRRRPPEPVHGELANMLFCFVLTLPTVALFKKRELGAPKCHN